MIQFVVQQNIHNIVNQLYSNKRKKREIVSVGEDVEKRELMCTVVRTKNW